MSKILVLYYSTHGSTFQLARCICEGVLEGGSEYILRTVPSSSSSLGGAPLVAPEDYKGADGWIIGSPTRFGNMAAPMQAFFDSLGAFWHAGGLDGKPAAVFTSASSLHGGHESTLLSMHVPLLHLGAVIVGIPYYQTVLAETSSGGTPYGASHWARQPSSELTEDEKALATALGKRVALISQKLKNLC